MTIQLIQNKFKLFLLFFILFSICISYLSYQSSVAQLDIITDSSKQGGHILTFSDVDKMLSGVPNITASALPVDIWRVQYSLWDDNIEEAKRHVKSAAIANPHVYSSEYLQGLIFQAEGNLDSALYYSKRAFVGWPKNINHFNSYLDVLEETQDTVSLVNAFNILDISLKKRPEYFRRFYSSLNKIKLSYLVTDFDDQEDLNSSVLIGNTFTRGYNFPNGQVIRDTTNSYAFISKNIVANQNGSEFLYKINKDTLNFYYKRDPIKPVAKYYAKFSPKYNTLIFRNIEFEKDKFQDQFFIKN